MQHFYAIQNFIHHYSARYACETRIPSNQGSCGGSLRHLIDCILGRWHTHQHVAEHDHYPKWTRSISSTYITAINNDWDWFVRGDAIYFGKTWVFIASLGQCNDYRLFNTRVGAEREDLCVELWVKNAFDDDNWSACARWTDFSRRIDFGLFTLYQGVAITPQNKRQFGLRALINA